MNKNCTVEGCTNKYLAKGFCTKHYTRWRRYRDADVCHRFKWEEGSKKYLLYNAKIRARSNDLPFDLTPEDVKIPDVCPVLGIPLICSNGLMTDNSPNLDRIVPKLGYVKGNVHVISFLANRIKSNATPEQLMKVALYFKEK